MLKKARPVTAELTDTILRGIDACIEENEDKFTEIGVRSGMAGLALFHYACSDHYKSDEHFQKGNTCLEKCFERLNEGYISSMLYQEITELGLFIELCKDKGKYTDDTNDLLNDFDEILYAQMMDELEGKNFDPSTGALGYGFYFLSRLKSKPELKATVLELCNAVAGLSSKNAKGTFWKSKLKGDDSVYLGISHGTAALIMFFQKAVMNGIDFNWRDLIASASGYVVNNEWKGQPTFYPVIVGEQDGYSIFANNWCYGDPGTLYGLLQASLWLNDDELKKYTLEKFSHVVKRHNDNVYLVAGYGLLYGNAGLAMLYRKCHKLTKESFFNDAYHEHLDLLLANYNSCADFLGYRGYWNQDMEVTNYSFSEGMIGIALTLMADRDASFADYYHPFFYM